MTTVKCLDCGNKGDAEDGWFVESNGKGNHRCTKCGSYNIVYPDEIDCDHAVEWDWNNVRPEDESMVLRGTCYKCEHTFERYYDYSETYRRD